MKKKKEIKVSQEQAAIDVITIVKNNQWLADAIDSLTIGCRGPKLKVLNDLTNLINQLGEKNGRISEES